jgi:hypothetical protein
MSDNPEVDKAVNQLETQRPPIEDAAKVVDNAVGVYTSESEFYEDGIQTPPEDHRDEGQTVNDGVDTAPEVKPSDEAFEQAEERVADDEAEPDKPAKKTAAKKTAAKKTSSGNRAAKQNSTKEE